MRVTPLIASRFRSDGGAMFGLVPKPIWSRRLPPDELNRIPQHAHALLLELADGRTGLVDTGCGDPARLPAKEREQQALGGDWPLMDALQARGLAPAQIDFIILTHLHGDHAGGAVRPGPDQPGPHFPNARYYLHELEWADAVSGDPLLYKSYPPEIVAALQALPPAQRCLVSDAQPDLFPGVRLERSGGHTRGHAVIHLESGDLELNHPDAAAFGPVRHALFAGDVCPTHAHLRLVFQTAYDTYPLDTRRWKQTWLPRIAAEPIALFFDHDPGLFAACIAPDPRAEYVLRNTLPCPHP
jgi:glyoxylase-like metal-dependent hydrolase (beta-lactamase superfamily II)